MKHKPLKAQKTRKALIKQMRWLAEHMLDVGTSIDYFGGFHQQTTECGSMLCEAGIMVRRWADEIEAEL